jgi:hypothetical protein
MFHGSGATPLLICALLFAYFPAVPHSALGWAALFGLGVPIWLLLEWLGGVIVEWRFFARRSSGIRILLGIPIFLAFMVIAWACVRLVQAAVLSAK